MGWRFEGLSERLVFRMGRPCRFLHHQIEFR
jgi:hypothetical protein